MAVWSSEELQSLLGGPLDSRGLTARALAALVQERVPESEILEFKGRDYIRRPATPEGGSNTGSKDRRQEFAKDVLALANRRGGLLVLGVAEADGRADAIVPLTGSSDDHQQWLRTALVQFAAPLPEIDMVPIPLEEEGYALAVVIPPSIRAPHALLAQRGEDARNPLSYPVRDGTRTRWMHEHEVAERYMRRLVVGQQQQQQLAAVVATGRQRLEVGGTGTYYLYVALAPEVGAHRRLDRAGLDANHRWVQRQNVEAPGSPGPLFGQAAVRAAPGRTVVGGLQPDAVSGPYLELHSSGAAFAASSIVDVRPADQSHNGGQLPVWALTAMCVALVEIVGRWAADQAVVPGTALVEAGLIWGWGGRNALPRTELVSQGGFGEHVATAGAHTISGPAPKVETVYPLMAVTGTRGAVQVASAIMDDLVQSFGMGDCPYLEKDGSVVPKVWTLYEPAVREWAERHQVPTQVRG